MTRKRWITLAAVVAVLTLIICAFLFRSQIWVAITCSGGKPQAELEGPVVQDWVATYDAPGGEWQGDDDHAVAIQTDSLGNVYVTGSSGTIKYDSAGKALWVADSPADNYDYPGAIAVDAMHNVYVTGFSGTVKYDSAGNPLWSDTHKGEALALGTVGDVYVTDFSGTVKYDSEGNLLWTNTHKGSALAVNAVGNVYVTGDSGTVEYDSAGNLLWVDTHRGKALALDAFGNLYVTSGYGTVKYDSAGNLLWTDTYRGRALALDAFGNLHVTGSSGTAKYDSAGNLLWNDTTIGSDLAVDALGNAYVTIHNSVGIPNYYTTVKFAKDGEHLWTATLNGPVGRDDEARAVAVDPLGNIYTTGTITARECRFISSWRWDKDYATVKYTDQVE